MDNRRAYLAAKRTFDVFASSFGIAATSPLWLAAVLGIELSDPGPVFYMAQRTGKNDRVFKMFKFRSMRVDRAADEKSFRADKSRIFKWGDFMRSSKIDELPQLLNVFMGDMSMVGPRPASVDQVSIVRAGRYGRASKVKPGLTGPAALYDYIYGDTITDEDEYEEKVLPTRMELDVFYVENMDASLDVKMVWWTVRCILNSVFHGDSGKMLEYLRECADGKKA